MTAWVYTSGFRYFIAVCSGCNKYCLAIPAIKNHQLVPSDALCSVCKTTQSKGLSWVDDEIKHLSPIDIKNRIESNTDYYYVGESEWVQDSSELLRKDKRIEKQSVSIESLSSRLESAIKALQLKDKLIEEMWKSWTRGWILGIDAVSVEVDVWGEQVRKIISIDPSYFDTDPEDP